MAAYPFTMKDSKGRSYTVKQSNNKREYITVRSGDMLSYIAEAYRLTVSGSTITYMEIAKLNSLEDPNKIIVGQTIYLTAAPSGTSSKQPVNTRGVTITQFGLLAGDEDNGELYATWTWHREGDTSEYDIEWKWYRAGVWKYQDETNIRRYSTFDLNSVKDGITSKVQFRVRPVPKTDTKNNVEVKRFEDNLWSEWNECTYLIVNKPDIPTELDVELKDLDLTASVKNPTSEKASMIKFQLIEDGNLNTATIAKVAVDNSSTKITHKFKVQAGHSYTVRCCSNKDGNDSEWSDESSAVETKPVKVTLSDPVVREVNTDKEATVYLEWSKSTTAESYTLEYVSGEQGFFDGDDGRTEEPGITSTNWTLTKLKSGTKYSFRVKAVKGSESSEYSDVKTVTIGTAPTAPTTWSSTTTAMAEKDESVALYWVHNATDGSTQTSATVTFAVEGVEDLNFVANEVDINIGTIQKVEVDNDNKTITYSIQAGTSATEVNPTHYLILKTELYSNGAKITWNVTTTSSANQLSERSADRVLEIFSKPDVAISVWNDEDNDIGVTYYKVDYIAATESEDARYERTPDTISPVSGDPVENASTITGEQVRSTEIDGETVYYCVVEDQESALKSFPFNVKVTVTEESAQQPVEYQLSLIANEKYNTIDNMGSPVMISAGESVYSKHYKANGYTPLNTVISANDVSLENGQSYTLKCIVAMSSGLMIEAFTELVISWSATNYYLDATILVDMSNCSVTLKPYCTSVDTKYCRVYRGQYLYLIGKEADGSYQTYDYAVGSIINGAYVKDGNQEYPVYQGSLVDGTEVYYAIINEYAPVEDIFLSVYRREYDGSFAEIFKDLEASENASVTDLHPALDFARYRIVATDKTTSAVTYRDIANYPIGEKAIIIQWAEPYSSYAVSEDGLSSGSGVESLLRLPYNIDITNTKDREVSMIKYIGRKHPVTYYGTQVGETANWSTVIPKSDTETIYALQRLQAYAGDVYVREPYGSGYWANVKVSFSKTHLETTIPVTIDVTRVEGGA